MGVTVKVQDILLYFRGLRRYTVDSVLGPVISRYSVLLLGRSVR